jgi:hypothetical protein
MFEKCLEINLDILNSISIYNQFHEDGATEFFLGHDEHICDQCILTYLVLWC